MKAPNINYKVLILIVVGILGSLSIFFLGSDNIVEQGAESFIRSSTGIEIDLSPDENK